MTVLNVLLSLNYFFYKSAAIIVSYVEIHHKTAFEAKSLDFLAFCFISLILTEIFLDILLNLLLYTCTCTCINLERENSFSRSRFIHGGGGILNQLLNPLCMFIYHLQIFRTDIL